MNARAHAKGEIRRALLYARVSTVEQAERELSLPAQIDALRRYCAQRGYEVAGEYIEPGASGTDDNRKIFRSMLEAALAPSANVQAVLVLHTSRFMRNATRARALKDTLRRRGIRVVAIQQETADDPMGQLVEGIFELVDQYESEVNGLRTSAAMRENAKQGFFNGSSAPYGYRVERAEVRPGVCRGKLVPHPDEIALVREVFRLYVEHHGAKGVARALNQRGLRYRKGHLWTKDLVLRVISEEAAVGTFWWGRRTTKRAVKADREDWIAIPTESILDREVFDLAQSVQDDREPTRNPGRTSTSPLLLAGLVKCGRCGASFQLETSGKRGPDGEYTYRYYNCRSTLRTGKERCDGYRVRTEVIEKAVLEHLVEKLFSEERCRKLLDDLVARSGLLRGRVDDQRALLMKERDDLDKRIARWLDAFETGAMPDDLGADRVRELRARRVEIDAALAKVVPLRPPPPHLFTEAAMARFQQSVRELFLEGNALTKHYLRHLVAEVVVTDGDVVIRGRRDAVLTMMAANARTPSPLFTKGEGVLTSGVGWLRLLDSNQRPGG